MDYLSEERQESLLNYIVSGIEEDEKRKFNEQYNIDIYTFAKNLDITPFLCGNEWHATYGRDLIGVGDSPFNAISDLRDLFFIKK